MSDTQTLQSPHDLALLFRGILGCFAKPGVPARLATPGDAPLPLLPGTAAIALTLFDYQTAVWLSPALNSDPVRKFIRFHTGAAITANAGDAVFAIMTSDEANAGLPDFSLGTHEYPDRSTTVILQVASFSNGRGVEVSGPGLKSPVSLQVEAANPVFWQNVRHNSTLFPVGLDFVFVSPAEVVALPRSSHINLMETA